MLHGTTGVTPDAPSSAGSPVTGSPHDFCYTGAITTVGGMMARLIAPVLAIAILLLGGCGAPDVLPRDGMRAGQEQDQPSTGEPATVQFYEFYSPL